ncbi:DUF202 domain-containing protein [Microbacterium lushaniae]|uniref:DUF202 domain-containing protein n=1 Tax=Microbacterium lushaniae TaxID=2614639 RepID=A0A5J6L1H6_9MICO|nr:DUF202 domain-containing protein [Microbacterium lushaniae]QEW02276.1 DUF202 domain-containing protein [Microbacterium lushaniae]
MTLFDPGLQPERTELAWRRTALAIGIGSLFAVRLLPAAMGSPWWALPGFAGILLTAALWLGARRRHRAVADALLEHGDRAALPAGGLPAVLAAVVTLIGAGGVASVVAHAASAGG